MLFFCTTTTETLWGVFTHIYFRSCWGEVWMREISLKSKFDAFPLILCSSCRRQQWHRRSREKWKVCRLHTSRHVCLFCRKSHRISSSDFTVHISHGGNWKNKFYIVASYSAFFVDAREMKRTNLHWKREISKHTSTQLFSAYLKLCGYYLNISDFL